MYCPSAQAGSCAGADGDVVRHPLGWLVSARAARGTRRWPAVVCGLHVAGPMLAPSRSLALTLPALPIRSMLYAHCRPPNPQLSTPWAAAPSPHRPTPHAASDTVRLRASGGSSGVASAVGPSAARRASSAKDA